MSGGAPAGTTIGSVEAQLPVTGQPSPCYRWRKCR
jgi:hypothetical protein